MAHIQIGKYPKMVKTNNGIVLTKLSLCQVSPCNVKNYVHEIFTLYISYFI